jgi:hypothetical protein
MELEKVVVLVDNTWRDTLCLKLAHLSTSLENLSKLVRQVILATHGATVDGNGRANGRGRDGQNGEDHPVGTRELGIETHDDQVLVGDLLENLVDLVCRYVSPLRLGALLNIVS